MHATDTPGSEQRAPLLFVYGDSMSMPRVPDGVQPQDTMAELLAAHCAAAGRPVRLYNRSESGKTIRDHWAKYKDDAVLFGAGREDVLIFQAGVVDSAPRPLPLRWRRKLERKPHFIRRPVIQFLKANRPMLPTLGDEFPQGRAGRFQDGG